MSYIHAEKDLRSFSYEYIVLSSLREVLSYIYGISFLMKAKHSADRLCFALAERNGRSRLPYTPQVFTYLRVKSRESSRNARDHAKDRAQEESIDIRFREWHGARVAHVFGFAGFPKCILHVAAVAARADIRAGDRREC